MAILLAWVSETNFNKLDRLQKFFESATYTYSKLRITSMCVRYVLGISETDSFHNTEPGPLPIHSVRSADHFYQKSFPQKFKERPSKMH